MDEIADINPSSDIPDRFYYIDLESVTSGSLTSPKIIEKEDAPSRAQRLILQYDILFQTVRPYQQNNYLASDQFDLPAVASTGYAQIRTKHNSHFLYSLLHTNRFLQEVLLRCTGSNYPAINSNDLKEIAVYYPSCGEQDKIALFMALIEKRIEKQRQLVEALKSYKRGAMQFIFHSSKEEWSCVQLGSIFKKTTRRNTDGAIKNVITNSAEYGLIPQRDFFDKDIAVDGNTLNYYVIETGDFVYNPRKSASAPYGPFNRYTLKDSGIVSPLYTCLVLKTDIEPSYLAWYFQSDAWHRYIYDNGSQGVRHDRVSMTDDLLMSIPVSVPPADKQRQIAQFLNGVETLLLTAQKKSAQLEKLKKGFLRQLFI